MLLRSLRLQRAGTSRRWPAGLSEPRARGCYGLGPWGRALCRPGLPPWRGGVLCTLTCRQCGFLSKVYSLLIKPVSLFWVSPAVGTIPSFTPMAPHSLTLPPWRGAWPHAGLPPGHAKAEWGGQEGINAFIPASLALTASRSRMPPAPAWGGGHEARH